MSELMTYGLLLLSLDYRSWADVQHFFFVFIYIHIYMLIFPIYEFIAE